MKHTLKLLSAVLALALCAGLFAACDGSSDALMGNSGSTSASASASAAETHEPGLFVDGEKVDADPMMTVNGNDVSFDLFRYYYLSSKARFDSGDDSLWTGEDAEDAKQQLLDYTNEGILSGYAIMALAEENNIALTDADKKELDDNIATLTEQLGGEDAYQEALASQHYTDTVYRELYSTSMLMEKVLTELYGADIKADIAKNYVRAQHILVKYTDSTATEHADELAKAQEILDKLNSGEDFEALMAEFNEDTGEPDEGYYFTTGEMVQEFEDAAFALKEGEISEIVPTSYGYHILRRLPMEEDYINQNLTTMLSDDMVTKVTEAFDAKAKEFKVTYNDNYQYVAPDTLF